MKQLGNILCTLAILTQIILSSGWVTVHQPDCQSSKVTSKAPATDSAQVITHTHSCSCGHHHEHSVLPIENDQQTPQLKTDSPNSPCTCKNSSPENYTQQLNIVDSSSHAKQYIAQTPRQCTVMTTAQALALTLPSNPPPPDTHRYNSGSYMATHVGIYLL